MKKIKAFFVENGFTSVIILGISVVAFILGREFIGAFFLGGFVIRNWEIINKIIKEKIS